MHIFLAGGTGVIGSRLIPALLAAGHTVTATTRRPARLPRLETLGAQGVVVDVTDADGLRDAVAASRADLVIHQLTDLRDSDTDANAALRRVGTANLVDAMRHAGIERIIGQSITWIFPDGDRAATETDPIVPGTAVDEMERRMRSVPHTTVLRYGTLYGPGTWYAPGGRVAGAVMAGLLPATPAITTFAHIEDVVAATVQAIDWPDGTYQILDDEPAAGTEWLPVYAAALGAPTPERAPLPDGAAAGRAVSNARAKAAGWVPLHPTWRTGFAAPDADG